jgi:uncharacterized membrane protein YcaP (DUF421 family)
MEKQLPLFWNGFEPLLRIIVVGSITYLGIVILMNLGGKRTIANMNALDFVITVAIGSAFGRILTAKQVTVSEAVVAFILLVSIKFLVGKIELHFHKFARFITPQPKILYYKGKFYDQNLKKEKINKRDLDSELRKKSIISIEKVEAIILESNGDFSILSKSDFPHKDVLKDLEK